MLLMLEDNPERIQRFQAALRHADSKLPLRVWRDANKLMAEAGSLLATASLISLDHDLESDAGDPDPGDGVMVAKWLVAQGVVRPVIIHSSNGERTRWMEGEFELAGWRYRRVVPSGDDWIEREWSLVVRELLNQPARRRGDDLPASFR